MKQENRMNCFANSIVTSEGKGNITYSAAYFGQWHFLLDYPSGFNKIDCIVIMFFDTCCNSKYVWVENYILRIEAYFFGEYFICFFTNCNSSFKGVCLTFFIKGHYYYRSSIALTNNSLFFEF